jgi:hypothetical protein
LILKVVSSGNPKITFYDKKIPLGGNDLVGNYIPAEGKRRGGTAGGIYDSA